MTSRLFFLLSLLVAASPAFAQSYSVVGRVVDAKDASAITGVSATLISQADTNSRTGMVTDYNGDFEIVNVGDGRYTLRLDYLGYRRETRDVTVAGQNAAVGTIKMTTGDNQLKGVTVGATQIRSEQKGDTTQFNAGAFKTNPDASAEDLVSKMPGITSDATGVKVNGETVQQIYVDGKPFFGTDPSLALKNLPAEVIDKIQVFDKLSDQSTFTGFDDGSTQKTINIITKKNRNEGIFGKVYAGYGTDDRYIVGGNLNIFSGSRRISLLGLSNNINQQNFSSEDILGATGGSGGGRSGGGRGGRGGGGGNNFLVGQQGGIATTNALGVNFSDEWGKKIKVSGSYFFNNTDNIASTDVSRTYFNSVDTSSIYTENSTSEAKNTNHRINLRLEYTIDSFNSVIFTPGISLQNNNTFSTTDADNRIAGRISSETDIRNTANSNGYNGTGNLLYQHKFGKPRRTISLNLNSSLNEKTGDGSYYSQNRFYEPDTNTVRDQRYTLYNNSNNLSGNITYTEPVGKRGQIMANYNPSVRESKANKETYNKDINPANDVLDPFFSNRYNNTYTTQRGGLSYRLGDRKLNFNAGVNIQQATLLGDQEYPNTFRLERKFTNVLPTAMLNYKYADGRNLRIMYRTATEAPSITQLQNVIDISNPLLLKTGNAALNQDFQHTLILRYGLTQSKKANSFFVNLYGNYVQNYIGNATYLPTKDSLYTDPVTNSSILINRGSQLTRPVNIDGYINTRSFVTYGMPVKDIKSNLNVNGGFNYMRAPGLVNDRINYSNSYVPSAGLVLSSNISENLDFTLLYSGNYNIVKNTIQSQNTNNFYNHTASFRINYIFMKSLVVNSNINHNYYTAFSGTGNQSYFLWNAYVGYKLLKDKSLEARLVAYDILKQNQSISRTVTETYIENSNTRVLQQYFMVQLTYTMRRFKGAGGNTNAPAGDEARPDNTRPQDSDAPRRDRPRG